jgi:glycosyltransferase involved in cell wall biosynthesis
LGFLARLCPVKGLDILVDAFIELKKSGNHEDLYLRVAGGMTKEDVPFVKEQETKLHKAGLNDFYTISPNISRAEKINFLRNLTIFSVPARYPEAFGLYVVEALLVGTPVVLPDTGAFPEILSRTKGGLIYEKGKFSSTLKYLLENLDDVKEMGLNGRKAVVEKYCNEKLAKSLIDIILAQK